MRVIKSAQRMQQVAEGWVAAGTRIGFVPTMGFLHRGHVSLIERARKAVGIRGQVVVSIYVNPTQFGPKEDFIKYPRNLAQDKELCRAAGVDVIFAPTDRQMYPVRPAFKFRAFVVEEELSRRMEGESRPTHFRGVTTVVAKLFNIVRPSVAVFGAKDYQQTAVVTKMAEDLNFPVRIIVAPTVRESDGLALSSRNNYLTPDQRQQATVLWRSIELAQRLTRTSRGGIPADALRAKLLALIHEQTAARVDYIEFFHPETLMPVKRVAKGTHMALAVFVGRTRLIDNACLA